MLSPQEVSEINAAKEHYAYAEAMAIDALMIVQRHRGWISDDALQDLADALEMTTAELDSLATFYNLIFRKPVGRHIILVCDSVSCWMLGCENLLQKLKSRLNIELGQTTDDGRFTLLPHVCLGACDRAPVMMIDDELFGELDAEKIDAILERYA